MSDLPTDPSRGRLHVPNSQVDLKSERAATVLSTNRRRAGLLFQIESLTDPSSCSPERPTVVASRSGRRQTHSTTGTATAGLELRALAPATVRGPILGPILRRQPTNPMLFRRSPIPKRFVASVSPKRSARRSAKSRLAAVGSGRQPRLSGPALLGLEDTSGGPGRDRRGKSLATRDGAVPCWTEGDP